MIFLLKAVLLTGSMTAKEKRRAYDRIESGFAKIIIGTHALIQDAVNYDNLALVVTDEQHRFGVKQRETFAQKGEYTACACYECDTDSAHACNHFIR